MAATVAAAALAAGAGQVILVGPDRPDVAAAAAGPGRVVMAREDPPGAGPVPALRAGLALARAPWVAVLAADLPFLRGDRLAALLAAACGGAGAVIADACGTEQWLAGCWPTGRLAAALAAYPGRSLRGLMQPLAPARIQDPAPGGRPVALAGLRHPRRARGRPGPRAGRGVTVSSLDHWMRAACAELGLDPALVPATTVLDLAREAAHQVERPAAPLTAFLLGLAVGRGQPPDEAARRLTDLAARWENPTG